MLCKLLVKPFNTDNWSWERKYDGFRAVATVSHAGYTLQARSGTDKTKHFPELKFAIRGPVVLDGEIISANGLTFQEGIQPRINRINKQVDMSITLPAIYLVFDILRAGDNWLYDEQLTVRRNILAQAVCPTDNVQLAPIYTDGVALFEQAKAERWEGVVGKNNLQGYNEGKRHWIKVKCWKEGQYYVAGFTEGTGKRKEYFGALLLCDSDGNPVGEVGTGFNEATLAALTKELNALPLTGEQKGGIYHYHLQPDAYFPANIKYLELTNAGQLRFPVYLGKVK
jgi:bifunctional non-homologous end joining protein LigD